jgi:hypothetical protein
LVNQAKSEAEAEQDARELSSINPVSLILLICLLLLMIAVPSFEQNRKHEIHSIFATIVNTMMPATELGIISILLYASIVAVWDGISVLPARYIELFVAMSFTSVQ